jgi:small subunit ribosomal protein S3
MKGEVYGKRELSPLVGLSTNSGSGKSKQDGAAKRRRRK